MLYKKYCCVGLFLLTVLNGCSKDHLDPTQIGRFRPVPAVNIILDSLGVSEESASEYEGTQEPRPADVVAYDLDYAFASGDTIRISVFELLQENVQYVENYAVNESGNISIPEIGQIQAGGLTESQLEDEIRNALSPGILKNPSVTVSLMQSQNRVFTVLGDGVNQPGRYAIPRSDYRLMDALADAGSARQFNVSYIYVTRRITGEESLAEATAEVQGQQTQPKQAGQDYIDYNHIQEPVVIPQNQELFEVIAPSISSSAKAESFVISTAELVTDKELEMLAMPETIAGAQSPQHKLPENVMLSLAGQNAEQESVEWVFKDGKWVAVRTESAATQSEPQQQQSIPERPTWQPKRQTAVAEKPMDFGWDQIDTAGVQTRVIKVPKDKLFGGDPRYNIIIKPGDTVTAQLDVVGEFYVLGNVNNQGIINLTGRPMTLKMAIAAAGGLGQLAWPKKCEVIRRIGEKKEEIVMVDLEKIANGTQPDFFIKPNDVINVGTHSITRFMAVIRNAFRASYGFGFIYDRNFADVDYFTRRPFSGL